MSTRPIGDIHSSVPVQVRIGTTPTTRRPMPGPDSNQRPGEHVADWVKRTQPDLHARIMADLEGYR